MSAETLTPKPPGGHLQQVRPPQPPHQDGAEGHLEHGHLVTPNGIAFPRGVFQSLPAPEVHTLIHGSHTGLEGHRAAGEVSGRLRGFTRGVRLAGLRSMEKARG